MNAAPEPLTLTAGDITRARRLAVLLTVNQLGVAVLEDRRAPAPLQAQQPAPNATPRGKPGLTTADYLQAHHAAQQAHAEMVEAAYRIREAERFTPGVSRPDLLAARADAERRHRKASVHLTVTEATLRADLAPPARPGHLTAYRVRLPTVQYVSPLFGLHALSEPHEATIDTAMLEGDDLAYFLDFMRTFPGRPDWPLYSRDPERGLREVNNHLLARHMRRVLGGLVDAQPHAVPRVYPVEAMAIAEG